MKRKILSIALGVALLVSSCSDFLNQEPLNTPDETMFWKTEADAQMALNNLYSYLPNQYRYWTECLSDNAIMTNAWGEGGMGEIKQGNLTAAVGNIQSTNTNFSQWRYDHIRQILNFIDKLKDIPFADENNRKKMEGEARFILAIKYFYLARIWGDVPLIKEKPLTLEEAKQIGKSPRKDVFAYALDNVSTAITYLPATNDKTGKITRYAAYCLKTDILMWLASLDQFHGKPMSDKPASQLWREAANSIQNVIKSDKYILEDDFVRLFESVTNNTDNETILARQYMKDQVTNMTNLLGIPGGVSLRGGGWASFSAPRGLVDDYECTDGKGIKESTVYDYKNPWENRDNRLTKWFLLPGQPVMRVDGKFTPVFNSHPESKTMGADGKEVKNREAIGGEGGGGRSGYWCSKYVEMDTYESNGCQNWIIYRYAEALLFLAECLNEVAPTNDSIRWAMDEIRIKRAGLPSVATLLGNQADMRTKIFRERRFELVNEDKRYWDLLRTKQAEVYMNPPGGQLYGVNSRFEAYTDSLGHWDCKMIIAEPIKFDATKGYVWPVPQDVMDKNRNIKQTAEWK